MDPITTLDLHSQKRVLTTLETSTGQSEEQLVFKFNTPKIYTSGGEENYSSTDFERVSDSLDFRDDCSIADKDNELLVECGDLQWKNSSGISNRVSYVGQGIGGVEGVVKFKTTSSWDDFRSASDGMKQIVLANDFGIGEMIIEDTFVVR